jgi:hypothetical protein
LEETGGISEPQPQAVLVVGDFGSTFEKTRDQLSPPFPKFFRA